ncbi:hypothetical protein NDU88_001759 [Pleurodeles waltl]|uniref:Uncharacterized protein n=1 Tax=Pleurodeles waltl TaxID=8319 RepID=A0AAV7MLW1_PLEWA|nr:hypothetical protein NDU88_001759 [Pleurodeles waltl]
MYLGFHESTDPLQATVQTPGQSRQTHRSVMQENEKERGTRCLPSRGKLYPLQEGNGAIRPRPATTSITTKDLSQQEEKRGDNRRGESTPGPTGEEEKKHDPETEASKAGNPREQDRKRGSITLRHADEGRETWSETLEEDIREEEESANQEEDGDTKAQREKNATAQEHEGRQPSGAQEPKEDVSKEWFEAVCWVMPETQFFLLLLSPWRTPGATLPGPIPSKEK